MGTDQGLRRLVGFADAVTAIAITILVLPLADSASSIGHEDVGLFLRQHKVSLQAFTLSFVVIGYFWWIQHQMFQRITGYNSVLVLGTFTWMFAIVFLPFPTELIGQENHSDVAAIIVYIGTLLVATVASVVQEWAIVRWPDLQDERTRGTASIGSGVVAVVLISLALIMAVTVPVVGVWWLALLLLSEPTKTVLTKMRILKKD